MGPVALAPLSLGRDLEDAAGFHCSGLSHPSRITNPLLDLFPAENSSSSGGSSMMGLLSKALGGSDNSSMGFGLDAASLLGAKTPGAFYVEVLKEPHRAGPPDQSI